MINTMELEIELKRANFSKKKLAIELGVSEMTLYNKLTGQTEFKISEVRTIAEKLNLTDAKKNEIFFNSQYD